MRMLFILCGASGLRVGEALGIRIEKILDNGSRIIIDEKMLLRFQKPAVRGNYETGNQAFSMHLRFLTIRDFDK
jgi:integrase